VTGTSSSLRSQIKFIVGSGDSRKTIPLATGKALHEQRRAIKQHFGLIK
jgi:beta-lactam-binding protein with PASTA domain